jgi:hypothetical protein
VTESSAGVCGGLAASGRSSYQFSTLRARSVIHRLGSWLPSSIAKCTAPGWVFSSSHLPSDCPHRGGAPRGSPLNRRSPARVPASPRAHRSSCGRRNAPTRSLPRSSSRRRQAARRPAECDAVDVHTEAGADCDGPSVDARFDFTGEERLSSVLPPAVVSHQHDRLAALLGVRVDSSCGASDRRPR